MLPEDLKAKIKKTIKETEEYITHLNTSNIELQSILNQQVLFIDEHLTNIIYSKIKKADYLIKSIENYDRYFKLELIYPSISKTKEKQYHRDMGFSLFHKSFNPECMAYDIDFIETRTVNGITKPILIYDTKIVFNGSDLLDNLTESKRKSLQTYEYIAKGLHIPFWLVAHDIDLQWFDIYEIYTPNKVSIRKPIPHRKTPEEFRKEIEFFGKKIY